MLSAFFRGSVGRVAHVAARRCSSVAQPQVHAPSSTQLRTLFLHAAVPMVGFGFMDNSIMILTGDLIDSTIGQRFQMATMTAAACGQLCSDTCGVCFGGFIEAMATKVGLPIPALSAAQRQLRICKMYGTAGAATGVIIGCGLGMLNLLWLDLGAAEQERRLEDMHQLFTLVVKTGQKTVGAETATIFVHDTATNELSAFVPREEAGGPKMEIRIPASAGLAGAALKAAELQEGPINVRDAHEDPRFCGHKFETKSHRTREVLCCGICLDSLPIAVIQFVNKEGGFTAADESIIVLIAEQTVAFVRSVGGESALRHLFHGDGTEWQ
eukprot:TRINITY_DN70198_c0_g1_i1.p1 TRINITY_DN70198_c0_g1~~TRINITY_DN70198_c0_g1_i1.p1  ORF type:complete len:347 (-),score=48.97 TRINITY_DN70198_c0_g1_i1:39-1016(-)